MITDLTTTIQRCKTCTWWDRTAQRATLERGGLVPHYVVEAGHVMGQWHACTRASSKVGDPSAYGSEAHAFGRDSDHTEARHAELWTAEDFGCVQHEPREDAT